jgi:hypothetical protein
MAFDSFSENTTGLCLFKRFTAGECYSIGLLYLAKLFTQFNRVQQLDNFMRMGMRIDAAWTIPTTPLDPYDRADSRTIDLRQMADIGYVE